VIYFPRLIIYGGNGGNTNGVNYSSSNENFDTSNSGFVLMIITRVVANGGNVEIMLEVVATIAWE